jgi:hypothetical protein
MSVFFTEEQVGELRVLRKAMRCCVRCAMRYACLRDAAPYQLSEEELEAAVASPESEEALATQEEAAAVDEAPAAICPLCLGCLQQCVQPAAIEAVANVVRSSGFEARDFALAVSVPVQLLLRERGGWLHLQRARAASTAASGGGFSLIGPTHGRGGGSAVGGTRAPSAAVGHPRYDKSALCSGLDPKRYDTSPLFLLLTHRSAVTPLLAPDCRAQSSTSRRRCAGQWHRRFRAPSACVVRAPPPSLCT